MQRRRAHANKKIKHVGSDLWRKLGLPRKIARGIDTRLEHLTLDEALHDVGRIRRINSKTWTGTPQPSVRRNIGSALVLRLGVLGTLGCCRAEKTRKGIGY